MIKIYAVAPTAQPLVIHAMTPTSYPSRRAKLREPSREKRPFLKDPLILPMMDTPLFVAGGSAAPVTFTKEPCGEFTERESVRSMPVSTTTPSPGPDATAFMPCRARCAMCFCSRVGCAAELEKVASGDWGGVMFGPGS